MIDIYNFDAKHPTAQYTRHKKQLHRYKGFSNGINRYSLMIFKKGHFEYKEKNNEKKIEKYINKRKNK